MAKLSKEFLERWNEVRPLVVPRLFEAEQSRPHPLRGRLADGLCWGNCPVRKTVLPAKASRTLYPSDQLGFPCYTAAAAFRRNKYFGLYPSRIHTKKDTVLQEENTRLLRDGCKQKAPARFYRNSGGFSLYLIGFAPSSRQRAKYACLALPEQAPPNRRPFTGT